jgi:hypothetical protein
VSFLLNLELDSGGSVCRCGVWLCVLRFKVGCDRVREGREGCGWLAFEDGDVAGCGPVDEDGLISLQMWNCELWVRERLRSKEKDG